jgi:hypothetical protein
MNDHAQHLFEMAQSERQFGSLVRQHAHAAHDFAGIAPTSVSLDSDPGADACDGVWNGNRDVVAWRRIPKCSRRAVDDDPDEILSAIAVKIEDQRRLAKVPILHFQGRSMVKRRRAFGRRSGDTCAPRA